MAALSASGLAGRSSCSWAFRQIGQKPDKQWFAKLADESTRLVFYEAPHRIRRTLQDMLQIFGDRVFALGTRADKGSRGIGRSDLFRDTCQARWRSEGSLRCVVARVARVITEPPPNSKPEQSGN